MPTVRVPLFSINLTTGAGTSCGNTGLEGIFDIASDPSGSGFDAADGNTFALYKLTVATGAAAETGSYQADDNIAGLPFLAPAPAAPEPGSIVLLTAGPGVIGFAACRGQNPSR